MDNNWHFTDDTMTVVRQLCEDGSERSCSYPFGLALLVQRETPDGKTPSLPNVKPFVSPDAAIE